MTVVAVASGYAALFRIGAELAIPPGNVTAVFPASGWAMASVFLRGKDAALGVWLGSLVANLVVFARLPGGTRLSLALWLASAATLQALVQTRSLRRHSGGNEQLESPGGVLYFALVGGLLGCLVSSLAGLAGLLVAGLISPGQAGFTWLTWWLGDTAGVLLVGALILSWPLRGPRRSLTEGLALFGATIAIGVLTLRDVLPMSHFLLPMILWAAYRFGPRETSLIQLLIALLGVGATVRSVGVYQFFPKAQALVLLQSFLTMTATFGLTLAALVYRQRGVEQKLQAANEGLKQHTRDLESRNEQLRAAVIDRSDLLDRLILGARGEAMPRAEPLVAGTIVGGRARVVRLLDRGGMGEVYQAIDLLDGRPVALKLQREQGAPDEASLRRFVAEARSAAVVDHPAIVRTLHLDVTDEGRLFLLLEFIEGKNLAERLERIPPPSAGESARIGAVAAEALAAAHAVGIVHRDIKPANLMLTLAAPGLKVLDFGIARRLDGRSAPEHLTSTAVLLGSPSYMSPEQIRNPHEVGPPCDIYSLGIVLFMLLSGRLPFERSSRADLLSAHLLDPLPPFPPTIPPELVALVVAMTTKEPADRPDAASVARSLTAFADAASTPSLSALNARMHLASSAETAT